MGRTSILVLIALLTAGCASHPRVIVGSKNFTEQVLLGEMVSQQIERRLGIQVERKFDLGGTLLAHEALKTGSISLYPEYTGTALTAVLKRPVVKDAKSALDQVREGYSQWGINQLRKEKAQGSWYEVPENADAVFSTSPAHLWEELIAKGRMPEVEPPSGGPLLKILELPPDSMERSFPPPQR